MYWLLLAILWFLHQLLLTLNIMWWWWSSVSPQRFVLFQEGQSCREILKEVWRNLQIILNDNHLTLRYLILTQKYSTAEICKIPDRKPCQQRFCWAPSHSGAQSWNILWTSFLWEESQARTGLRMELLLCNWLLLVSDQPGCWMKIIWSP